MNEFHSSTTISDDLTNKFYKKYYEELTESQPTSKEKKRRYKINTLSPNSLFLEEKYGYKGNREIINAHLIKPKYLETERLSFGAIGIITFFLIIFSIIIGNINLLVASSSVFIMVWIFVLTIFFINRIIKYS